MNQLYFFVINYNTHWKLYYNKHESSTKTWQMDTIVIVVGHLL